MVISPGSSHTLRMSMVRYYVAVIREFLVANCALSALFGDLPIEQLAHLGRRPKFPVLPGVMWIFDTLNTEPQSPFLLSLLTATAVQRAVDRTHFVLSES